MDFWSTEFNLLICVKRTGFILADRFCPGELQGQRSGRQKEEVQPAADFQLRFWSDVWAFVSRLDLLPGISQNSLFLKPMCSGSDEVSLPVLKLLLQFEAKRRKRSDRSEGSLFPSPQCKVKLRHSQSSQSCKQPGSLSVLGVLLVLQLWDQF